MLGQGKTSVPAIFSEPIGFNETAKKPELQTL